MKDHVFAAGWLAGRAEAPRPRNMGVDCLGPPALKAGAAEDLEAYRCAGCRVGHPAAPMRERLSECADCQAAILLAPEVAR